MALETNALKACIQTSATHAQLATSEFQTDLIYLFYLFSDFTTMQTREQWPKKMKGKEGLLKVNTINVVQPS